MTDVPSDPPAATGPERPRGRGHSDNPGTLENTAVEVPPNVRRLDPVTALRGDAPGRLSPTYYVADQLLIDAPVVNDRGRADALAPLNKGLARLDVSAQLTTGSSRRLPRREPGDRALSVRRSVASSIQLSPTKSPAALPDAWAVLQELRQTDSTIAGSLSLNHVMHPAIHWPGIGEPAPDVNGGGTRGWDSLGGYGSPGFGARMPVSVVMQDPGLRAQVDGRHPVIAMLDTPVAEHPWFPAVRPGAPSAPGTLLRYVVTDNALVQEGSAGSTPAPAAIGEVNPRTGSRQRLEGHGTFIAGLLRQRCPEACILSAPVMDNDGYAEEGEVLHALTLLYDMHRAGQRGEADGVVIDVLSLSMGYYAEDESYRDGRLQQALSALAAAGVLVVAGVGNDASIVPFVPAALASAAPTTTTDESQPPVLSVSANNPDGHTVALFSNEVNYVSAYRPGVAVVSTMPPVDGVGQSSVAVPSMLRPRGTMDPDNFLGGFGVWSGTSFAAPVFAGELAAALVTAGSLSDVTAPVMRERALKAIAACGDPK